MPHIKRGEQRGSTLLEVLIAIVVLSFGLLGMAGLQGASLKVNHSAMQHSHATVLGYDMLDRLRLSPPTGRQYDVDLDDAAPEEAAEPEDDTVRDADIRQWRRALVSALGPDATGGVCRSDIKGNCEVDGKYHRIVIRWVAAAHEAGTDGGVAIGHSEQSISVIGSL